LKENNGLLDFIVLVFPNEQPAPIKPALAKFVLLQL
jgi:hypothetical protein